MVSWMYQKTNQAVCKSQKSILMIDKHQKNYIKKHQNTSQSIKKKTVTMLNAQMNITLLHRCSYTSNYNAKTSFSWIWVYDLHIEFSLSIIIWHIWCIQ